LYLSISYLNSSLKAYSFFMRYILWLHYSSRKILNVTWHTKCTVRTNFTSQSLQLAEVIVKVTMEIVPYRSKEKLFVITYLNSSGKWNGQFNWTENPQLHSVVLDCYVGRTPFCFQKILGLNLSPQPGYPDLNPFMVFVQFLQAKAVMLPHVRPNCFLLYPYPFIIYLLSYQAIGSIIK